MIETRSVAEQLLQLCQEKLSQAEWAVGERFPSERELAAQHKISRATANKVLSKLVSEGWLEIRRGQGTFVAQRPTIFAALRQMESFTDFAASIGMAPSTKVLQFRSNPPGSASLKQELGLAATASVYYLKRVRSMNGIPVIFEERWLPYDRYENLVRADLDRSFYRLCRELFRIQITREEVVATAEIAPEEADFGTNQPTICLEGFGFDPDDSILWKQRIHYRGECFQLSHATNSANSFPQIAFQLREAFISSQQTESK